MPFFIGLSMNTSGIFLGVLFRVFGVTGFCVLDAVVTLPFARALRFWLAMAILAAVLASLVWETLCCLLARDFDCLSLSVEEA